MKRLVILILIIMTAGCQSIIRSSNSSERVNNNKYKKTDLERAGVKGKVSSVTTVGGLKTIYNRDGNIKEISYTNDADKSSITLFYNDDGVLERSSKIENGSVKENSYYEYGKEESDVFISAYNSEGELLYRMTEEYDAKGNLIRNIKNSGTSDEVEKDIYNYKYDTKGRPVEVKNNEKVIMSYKYLDDEDSYYLQGGVIVKDMMMKVEIVKRDSIGNSLEEIWYLNGRRYDITKNIVEYYVD